MDNCFVMTEKDREKNQYGIEYRSNKEFIESMSRMMQAEKRG